MTMISQSPLEKCYGSTVWELHCLRTALCESIRYQAKSEHNIRQDLIPRVRHGEAALCSPPDNGWPTIKEITYIIRCNVNIWHNEIALQADVSSLSRYITDAVLWYKVTFMFTPAIKLPGAWLPLPLGPANPHAKRYAWSFPISRKKGYFFQAWARTSKFKVFWEKIHEGILAIVTDS